MILSQMLRGVAEVLGADDGSRPEPVVFAAALTRAADAGAAAVIRSRARFSRWPGRPPMRDRACGRAGSDPAGRCTRRRTRSP